MNKEQQRIAIAELCGWKREWVNKDRHIQQWVCRRPKGSVVYCDPDPNATWETHVLPDYLNDLNAMHEAEKEMTEILRSIYISAIANVIIRSGCRQISSFDYMTATASQRAEAFLRTMGKWVNKPLNEPEQPAV